MANQFIAALDQSGGSTSTALERYGQEYTEDNKFDLMHDMRMRMVNSPDFNDTRIWGAILFKDSVTRGLAVIMNAKNIKPFLKVDVGCEDNGYMKYFQVHDAINFAIDYECYGTKMRSVVKTENILRPVLTQQFANAEEIYNKGLMPIVEPEIPIDSGDKERLENILRDEIAKRLEDFDGRCILKLTLPEKENFYTELADSSSVERIVGLSGGYRLGDACEKLHKQDRMSASFSRALSEGLTINQTEEEFSDILSDNINTIWRAS